MPGGSPGEPERGPKGEEAEVEVEVEVEVGARAGAEAEVEVEVEVEVEARSGVARGGSGGEGAAIAIDATGGGAPRASPAEARCASIPAAPTAAPARSPAIASAGNAPRGRATRIVTARGAVGSPESGPMRNESPATRSLGATTCSARSSSFADENRCSRSRASARATIAATASGTAGSIARTSGASTVHAARSTFSNVVPRWGGRPARHSNKIAPAPYTSARPSTSENDCICSGAM
jgi:hypothetical protein